MEPIDANQHVYGVGNNRFLLEYLARQPQQSAVEESEPSPQAAPVEQTEQVDQARLSKDPAYLASTLGYLLQRARYYFRRAQYTEANREYRQYLFYEHRYATGYMGVTPEFFQVVFEYMWLLELKNHRKEAERLFNEQLLRLMEPMLNPKVGMSRDMDRIRQFVQTLQAMDQFPARDNLMAQVTNEALTKLAKYAISHGERSLAQSILSMVEVRYLMGVFRTERMIQTLTRETGSGRQGPSSMLPIIYSRIGLPYAPTNPLGEEEQRRMLSQELGGKGLPMEELMAEPVYGLPPIHKDPSKEEERRRRREKRRPADTEAPESLEDA
jgi:hypothetical protein